jgi:hypothetical protein
MRRKKTGNNAENTYHLLRPLLTDLELIGLRGYGFKFFIWDHVLRYFQEDARPDRVTQHVLTWTRQALETILSKRLAAFSDQRVASFAALMTSSPEYPTDGVICLLANRSPRNVIRICEKIFSVQAELDINATRILRKRSSVGSICTAPKLRWSYTERTWPKICSARGGSYLLLTISQVKYSRRRTKTQAETGSGLAKIGISEASRLSCSSRVAPTT